jgi:hypothetical protein
MHVISVADEIENAMRAKVDKEVRAEFVHEFEHVPFGRLEDDCALCQGAVPKAS